MLRKLSDRCRIWLLDLGLSQATRKSISEQRAAFSVLKSGSLDEQDALWDYIRAGLIKVPKWANGHRRLVELAISRKQVDWAYGSSIALQKLARSKSELAEADFNVARSLLAAGDYSRALLLLEEVSGRFAHMPQEFQWKLLSCKAAVYLALGRKEDAHKTLELIPSSAREPGDELVMRAIDRARTETGASIVSNLNK
jgi:tetratricopeptide (TPR) repeat protein